MAATEARSLRKRVTLFLYGDPAEQTETIGKAAREAAHGIAPELATLGGWTTRYGIIFRPDPVTNHHRSVLSAVVYHRLERSLAFSKYREAGRLLGLQDPVSEVLYDAGLGLNPVDAETRAILLEATQPTEAPETYSVFIDSKEYGGAFPV